MAHTVLFFFPIVLGVFFVGQIAHGQGEIVFVNASSSLKQQIVDA